MLKLLTLTLVLTVVLVNATEFTASVVIDVAELAAEADDAAEGGGGPHPYPLEDGFEPKDGNPDERAIERSKHRAEGHCPPARPNSACPSRILLVRSGRSGRIDRQT